MNSEALVVRDLYKSYGSHPAVDGISFTILRGEIFGLLGPNGAGKTTTISMLAGLTEPTGGAISMDGLDLAKHLSKVKARIGLVPQDLAIYPTLSARDNLLFFGRIYGLRGKTLTRRVDLALEMVQLAGRAGDRVETYSGGMKRRINLAAGLLHEPDILFLDEPTVGVDPQSRNAIFESIEALNWAGLTIIYTTHYMEEAQRLCHRVAIIDHGRVVALDTPANLIRSVGEGILRIGFVDGLAPAVEAQAKNLLAVHSASIRDGQLDLHVSNAQQALVGILDIANQLQARVTSLQILEPSLETVFLSITGKNLRD
ncbi:MAG TPA: ATP-binding cassette domain-containing protein [Anaerolineaceae bacterium]